MAAPRRAERTNRGHSPFAAVEIRPGFDHAIASAALGLVQRGIGTSEKLVDALARSPFGDAEAAGDRRLLAGGVERQRRQAGAKEFGVLDGGFAARALDQDREFLAAKAADDRVFTLKFAADDAENLIADIMPVGVVDALEMIDVEHDRGERRRPRSTMAAPSRKRRGG